jgi:hypothetical protein
MNGVPAREFVRESDDPDDMNYICRYVVTGKDTIAVMVIGDHGIHNSPMVAASSTRSRCCAIPDKLLCCYRYATALPQSQGHVPVGWGLYPSDSEGREPVGFSLGAPSQSKKDC